MADTKISALPSASTPLTGTEVLPIVQGAGNFKVSIADVTAGRAVSALSYTSTTGANFATTSGNVGIGTASPAVELEVSSATGSATPTPTEVRISTTTSAADWSTSLPWGRLSFYSADGSDAGPKVQGAVDMIADAAVGGRSSMVFSSAVATTGTLTERMRITATGNVGIGTAAPSQKLEVVGTSSTTLVKNTATTAANGFNAANTGGNFYFGIDNSAGNFYGGGAYTRAIYSDGAYPIVFYTNATEKMRLDSAGNLGLGVTPSDTIGYGRAFDIGSSTGAAIYLRDTDAPTTQYGFIAYDGNDNGLKINNQNSGGFIRFSTAGSERARIDASGNLLVGTTSAGTTWASGGNANIDLEKSATYSVIQAKAYSTTAISGGMLVLSHSKSATVGTQTANASGDSLGFISFEGVNTSSAVAGSSYITGIVDGANGATYIPGALAFYTGTSSANPSERMRLDSSGNLLVGTTSLYNSARVSVLAAGGSGGIVFSVQNNNDTYYAANFRNTAGTSVGSISCTTSATAYVTSSDYRLKNITGPITTSGAYIDSLKPVEGTWKADGSTFVGLIAHETQEASRTTVATGTKDGKEMQGMDYSSAEIIANLIAELQSLRARVAQLESK
jgi:hypothetical protein